MADLRLGRAEHFDVLTLARLLREIDPATPGNENGNPQLADVLALAAGLDPQLVEMLRGQRLPDGFTELIDNDLALLLARRIDPQSEVAAGRDLGVFGERRFSGDPIATTWRALRAELVPPADPTPREIRRAEDWLKRLGHNPGRIDTELTPQSI